MDRRAPDPPSNESEHGPTRSHDTIINSVDDPRPLERHDGPAARRASNDSESVHARDHAPRVHVGQNLDIADVACLIINKMIGTGIFTAPYFTLQATGSKGLTLIFWILGFAYTVLSMCLYLEYARDLPYTGGELIYLNDLFKKPRLLAVTMYAYYFVFVYNLVPNNLTFAEYILQAASPENVDANGISAFSEGIDRNLVCFIAFVVTTFVCLLLFFSSVKSRWVNKGTALLKIALLLVVLGAGGWYLGHNDNANLQVSADWGVRSPGTGWTQGIILVFFSYHGWENATFVAGEIPRYEVLRKGFMIAVFVIGILYVAIAAVFCASIPVGTVIEPSFQNYLAVYFGGSHQAVQASAILICLSSLGSMVSVTYTAVRVKQVLGWMNILPWSTVWRRTDLSRKLRCFPFVDSLDTQEGWSEAVNQAMAVRRGTPEGGIILHYIFSVILVIISRGIHDFHTSVSTFGSILIYGHFLFEMAVGFGYAFLFKPGEHLRNLSEDEWEAPYPPKWLLDGRKGMIVLGVMTGVVSTFIVAVQLVTVPGWWYICVMAGIFAVALTSWVLSTWRPGKQTWRYKLLGFTVWAQVHGKEHRHREDGYYDYIFIQTPNVWPSKLLSLTYLFGDSNDVGQDGIGFLGPDLSEGDNEMGLVPARDEELRAIEVQRH